jgi:hypothetical protein
MKKTTLLPLAAFAALAACATVPPFPTGSPTAAFGQTAVAGPVRVKPLALVEDSRCPQGVQCVWAGRVRITAAVTTSSGTSTRELTLGQPASVAGGSLTLVEVQPARRADRTIAKSDYRFTFSFAR